MKFRQIFGIDGFELIVHLAVTGILFVWIVEVNRSQDAVMFSSILAVASLVTLTIRRRLALRRESSSGITTGEMAAERLAELEGRMADLEAAQVRIVELEERLDFAERLLARPQEAKALPQGAQR